MNEPISRAVDTVIARPKAMLQERTKEGDTVMFVGVGKTIGINQQ